jgi:hypothetical protein
VGANGWPWGSDPSCPEGPAPQCPISPATDTANYFPHPTDCHYYIQCDGSRRPLCRACAPSTFFSPRILNCVWPLDAACQHNATTRAESLLPPTCGPDRCHSGTKKRDNSACTHYFQCRGASEHRRQCPVGQHFNARTNECDDQCTAGCEDPCTIPECKHNCKCDPNMPPRVDPEDCTICESCRGGQLVKETCPPTVPATRATCERIEDPADCQRYYDTCTDSWEHCPGNLHFNPVTRTCEDPCTAGCKQPCEVGGCFCPCDENMPPRVDPADCTLCEVCRGGHIVKDLCPPSLISTCTANRCCSLTRHEADCQLYYNHCSHTWSHCPGNLHFNEATQVCDHPCDAGCKDRRDIEQCCDTEGDVSEDPCSCDMYYICAAGIKVPVSCEYGQQYNSTLRRCDSLCSGDCPKLFRGTPECCASTCGKPEPQCPWTTYPMFLPHPSNSQFFYECFNGVRSCKRCPLQLHWNSDMDICVETLCPQQDNPFQSYGAQTKTSLH